MKRICLFDKIATEIIERELNDKPLDGMIKRIVKFVQNNYRRRKYLKVNKKRLK